MAEDVIESMGGRRKNTLRRAWGLEKELQISEVGNNLFQFKFQSEYELERILKGGPWTFDNQLLMLTRWRTGMSANNVVLEHASLWVQIWGVPFDMMSPSVAREVGNKMGRVEDVERRRHMDEQNFFLRVRVALPISKPLRRGGFLLGLDGKRHWVTYKYERMPMLCHFCGVLGHDIRHCSAHFSASKTEKAINYQYGDWLKADNGRPQLLSSVSSSHSLSRLSASHFRPLACLCSESKIGIAERVKDGLSMHTRFSDDRPYGGSETEDRRETVTGLGGATGSFRDHGLNQRQEEGGAGVVTPAKPPQYVTENVISGVADIPENTASDKPDFQEILSKIDAEISKFDPIALGSCQLGPTGALEQSEGQPIRNNVEDMGFTSELVMLDSLQGSPLVNNGKARSWKRLAQDRNPIDAQPVPTVKKRSLHVYNISN
ncbi:uncharacterized protein CFP56_011676 [Quercus suber]|uniref:DUF4283 domain-containing protein n=1 Tax=Quercus suber TaxID=58331 RepID=A0AAW0L1D3_QUESU